MSHLLNAGLARLDFLRGTPGANAPRMVQSIGYHGYGEEMRRLQQLPRVVHSAPPVQHSLPSLPVPLFKSSEESSSYNHAVARTLMKYGSKEALASWNSSHPSSAGRGQPSW